MSPPLRIIAADDDPTMLHYYFRIIPRIGHRLLAVAGNGSELVALALQSHPDLVITDIRMPMLDGLLALERVQSEADIPFIFVTADDELDHLDRLEGYHVLAYLQKPVRHTVLSTAVQSASVAISR